MKISDERKGLLIMIAGVILALFLKPTSIAVANVIAIVILIGFLMLMVTWRKADGEDIRRGDNTTQRSGKNTGRGKKRGSKRGNH